MNLLKRFIRDNTATEYEEEEEYKDFYPALDAESDSAANSVEEDVASLDSPARKDPEIHPATPEKVTLKLIQPRSHTEATRIADKLKEGCIVLLDISNLTKEQAIRLVDFLSGVAYVLGGEMIKTNPNTIVVSPSGVDVSGFIAEDATASAPAEETEEQTYEIEDAPEESEEI